MPTKKHYPSQIQTELFVPLRSWLAVLPSHQTNLDIKYTQSSWMTWGRWTSLRRDIHRQLLRLVEQVLRYPYYALTIDIGERLAREGHLVRTEAGEMFDYTFFILVALSKVWTLEYTSIPTVKILVLWMLFQSYSNEPWWRHLHYEELHSSGTLEALLYYYVD